MVGKQGPVNGRSVDAVRDGDGRAVQVAVEGNVQRVLVADHLEERKRSPRWNGNLRPGMWRGADAGTRVEGRGHGRRRRRRSRSRVRVRVAKDGGTLFAQRRRERHPLAAAASVHGVSAVVAPGSTDLIRGGLRGASKRRVVLVPRREGREPIPPSRRRVTQRGERRKPRRQRRLGARVVGSVGFRHGRGNVRAVGHVLEVLTGDVLELVPAAVALDGSGRNRLCSSSSRCLARFGRAPFGGSPFRAGCALGRHGRSREGPDAPWSFFHAASFRCCASARRLPIPIGP